MDGLDDLQRQLAWSVMWDMTFAGKAILEKDLSFRAVNRQFCRMLNVSPAEIMAHRFCDIMDPQNRKTDIENAKLIVDRVIESYVLQRNYTKDNGDQVEVVTITAGVYDPESGDLLFFVLHMMEIAGPTLSSAQSPHKPTLWTWLDKKKIGMSLITIAAAICAALADKIIKTINGVS